MKTKTIQTSGSIELLTEAFGEPINGFCLLISGAMAPARFWTDTFCESIAENGYLVIRYDHRDIGLSSAVDWHQFPYTLADLAADAIAILNGFGIQAAYCIGHSMGGHICQRLALDYPERIKGFSAISSGPIGSTPDTDAPLSENEKLILEETWKIFLARQDSEKLEETVNGFMSIWRYLNGSVPFDEEIARAYTIDLLTRTNHPIQAGNNHELVMRNLQESLPSQRGLVEKIQVPALILHGSCDPLSLPRDAKALANAIPNSKLVMVPGMGHMLFNRELESDIVQEILKNMHSEQINKIVKDMQANMHFQMTYFARYAPTMQLIEEADVTIVKSEIQDDTFNYVLGTKFSYENMSAKVRDIINLFKDSDTPFSWWVSDQDTPISLKNALINMGLIYKEENIGMYLLLDAFENGSNHRINFHKVDSYLKLKEFSEIIVSVGGNSQAFQKIYSKIPVDAIIETNDFEMYVGYLDDQPIVSGILVSYAGVAGIYYVATVPNQRKQGFGTAMMRYLLTQAKHRRIPIATLQASREGKSLYEKLGFKACSVFKEYAG